MTYEALCKMIADKMEVGEHPAYIFVDVATWQDILGNAMRHKVYEEHYINGSCGMFMAAYGCQIYKVNEDKGFFLIGQSSDSYREYLMERAIWGE